MRDERLSVHGRAIVVENFLPPEIVEQLLAGHWTSTNYTDERGAGITSRKKWEIEHVAAHAELMDFIRKNETLRFYVENFRDLSWKLVYNEEIKTCEMAISEYEPDSGFGWHVDHIMSDRRRVLNWMMTLEGDGLVEWCLDPMENAHEPAGWNPEGHTWRTILEPNTLVLMPSWYPHRVETLGPRTAFHGHFGI